MKCIRCGGESPRYGEHVCPDHVGDAWRVGEMRQRQANATDARILALEAQLAEKDKALGEAVGLLRRFMDTWKQSNDIEEDMGPVYDEARAFLARKEG